MEKMTIGFDAKRAVCNNTGLGNYSRLVVDVLSKAYIGNRYVLYSPVRRDNPRLRELLERRNVTLETPESTLGKAFSSLWRVCGGITNLLSKDGVDLFHGLSNELPLDIRRAGIPSVVTIHDLIFRRLPQCYAPVDRTIYDYKFKQACLNATRIIAISECTRRDIVELYGIDPAKIDIVYQGCDAQFSRPVSASGIRAIRETYGLPERYISAVGTVEVRKNQLQAVMALRGLPDDVSLVVVGGHNKKYFPEVQQAVRRYGLESRVRFLSGIPFGHLPAIYAGSVFSSYTSRYEGFGIPVIEAISSGVPVIAATGSCLKEAGGPGAVYVSPNSVDEYIEAARQLLDNTDLRADMVAKGRKYIRRFSPEEFSSGLIKSYQKAVNS